MFLSIGKDTGGGVARGFELELLLRTHLLVQAASGAGKSYLLRKLAEVFCSHVPVIILDPEGEFATLREKYPFVLVGGEGADAPIAVQTAETLAEKLLTLRASAVIDLYPLKKDQRHAFVKNFLEAVMESRKELWRDTIFIVDEAHLFCPQKDESVAYASMVDLATRGRKRGFCAIFATQRIEKLAKDAASELQNYLIGRTMLDLGIDRAADMLSIRNKKEFAEEIRMMPDGVFYALGRAIASPAIRVKVDRVDTTHPKAGSGKHISTPPPPPEKIRGMLPQLADIPRVAEQKKKTMEDLQHEVRSLRAQVAAKPKVEVDPEETKRTIQQSVAFAIRDRDAKWTDSVNQYRSRVRTFLIDIVNDMKSGMDGLVEASYRAEFTEPDEVAPIKVSTSTPRDWSKNPIAKAAGHVLSAPPDGLTKRHVEILSRLAELEEVLGSGSVSKEQLAAWCEMSPTGGGYNNYLGRLRSEGMMNGMALTDKGREYAQPDDTPLTNAEMLERAKRVLGGSEARILEAVVRRYPESVEKGGLAEQTGFSESGGGFNNYLGHMRTLGFIEYPQKGRVKAESWLFVE